MIPSTFTVGEFDHDRLWSKVDRSGTCWVWTGCLVDGYGQIAINKQRWRTHRLAWVLLRGEIPEGLVIDHLCRNRACVNPDHMEIVTPAENTIRGYGPWAANARKTHCIRGHEMSGPNVLIDYRNSRACRVCALDRNRRFRSQNVRKSRAKQR